MVGYWAPTDDPTGGQDAACPAQGEVTDPSGRGGAPILVVEDDATILAMLIDILKSEGYPVLAATNGIEGLASIRTVAPSLILLDMRMPRMDGWAFARALRERGIASPVVVMTAAENARRWAEEIGADGFIKKPFEFIELLDAIQRHRRREPTN